VAVKDALVGLRVLFDTISIALKHPAQSGFSKLAFLIPAGRPCHEHEGIRCLASTSRRSQTSGQQFDRMRQHITARRGVFVK